MKALVTGGAGFVGSHLVDLLLRCGYEVLVYDDFSTGKLANLDHLNGVGYVNGSLHQMDLLRDSMRGIDIVFHVAANADIRFNLDDPRRHVETNTLGTSNVLEAMRQAGVKRIAFTSTGSIYGEPNVRPTPEDAPFPLQTSLYSASKLAGEGLIEAYCEGYGFTCYITRHVGMVGERYAHGHLFDFYHRIKETGRLKVLNDGTLMKSYLYVGDAVRGILTAVEKATDRVNIFNVGSEELWSVRESAEAVCAEMDLPLDCLEMGQGLRGWTGDNHLIYLDCSRLRKLGWEPQVSVREGIHRTIQYLKEHDETAR